VAAIRFNQGDEERPTQASPQTKPIPRRSPEFPTGANTLNEPAQPCESTSSPPPNSPEFPIGENDLNERQHAAIELLVLGLAPGDVAKRMGIDRKTLFNWRQLPAFQCELARKRQELWSEVGDRVRGLVHPSLDEMEKQLSDRYDRSRFQAAVTILKLSNITKACADLNNGK